MAETDKRTTFLDKCLKDKKGNRVLGQRPNLPIIVWAVARLLAWPLGGVAEHVARVVAFGALFVWASLEILQGVNYFRRALGTVVMVMLLFMALR